MRIFVAGATGVIGHRAVARLVEAGHDVTGLARSTGKAALLRRVGATPVEASLFEPDTLTRVVAGHDAVVNLATAIPSGAAAADPSAWEENHRIRREGSRNLVDAAIAAGAQRYVQEYITFVYADGGDEWLDESSPVDPPATGGASLEAEAQAQRFAGEGGTGIVLRFGKLYGPDSAHTLGAVAAVHAGQPPELGPPDAFQSVVTTDDAAAAVVAVLDAPSGTYNVVDDHPLTRAEYVRALAEALDAPTPEVTSLVLDDPGTAALVVRAQRVSNRHLGAVTGWRPRWPSAREGWPFVVGEIEARRTAGVRP